MMSCKNKCTEVCQKHWIYFKTTMTILCPYLYVTPAQIECLSLYINQALLLNSFFKISIFNSCYPRSKVCMILESPPHLLLIFFFGVICFKLPITRTFFFCPEGSSYQESTVVVLYSFSNSLWMTNQINGSRSKRFRSGGGGGGGTNQQYRCCGLNFFLGLKFFKPV